MATSRLSSIADAMTSDTDVDWTSAEEETDVDEREAVRQLKIIASLTETARRLAPRWGPFEIRQEIGRGAFGTVYRAWDPKLGRDIALKLLHQEATDAAESDAIHEARLLASVEHPHIVPVYGADIHDGRIGIWMKFVHGRTLKDILTEAGPFAAAEAALIGRDLCGALAAVHACGLLHRDIKAQNVMREVGGRTILMDFGAGQPSGTAGSVRGTPAYLAPEVIEGRPATVQTDLYSLGVLLFHLVTGAFPLTATSWDDLRIKHERGERRLLRDLRPDLPAWFVDTVDRCLATDTRDRPQSAGEVYSRLDVRESPAARTRVPRLAMVAALGVLVAAGYGIWKWAWPSPVVLPGKPSVAILPFENRTGSTELDFLSRGLAQQVGARLSMLGGIRVVTTSNPMPIKTAGDATVQLGVQSIVACVLRGDSHDVRLSCDLRDGKSTRPVWADTTGRSVDEVASLEPELARRIAFALVGPVVAPDGSHDASRSVAPAAVSAYLRGRHEWSFRTDESLHRSIEYFQEAIRTSPDYALAYSGLADAYSMLGVYGFMPRPTAYTQALDAAQRAVELDANAADAHFSLGYARKNRFDWSGAEASLRRGLELNPNSSLGHHWLSIYLTQMARFPEAIEEARQAIALDPSSLAARTNFASLLVLARRYRDGIAQWEASVALGSNQVVTYRAMSKAYLYVGDHDKALAYAEQARQHATVGGADEELKGDLAYVFASTGHRDEAIELAKELVLRYRAAGEGIAGTIAAVYTGLGNTEDAFQWLAAAEREQDPELGYLLVDPRWDPLRHDQRFRQTLLDLNFPVE